MKKTYPGGCHCGAVRFEASLDLEDKTIRCNCSVCAKTRYWLAFVPADAVQLLQGEESLANYQFGAHRIHHRFCKICGVKLFGHTDTPDGTMYAVNLAAIEASDEELAAAPVVYLNGRDDDWKNPPPVTAHL